MIEIDNSVINALHDSIYDVLDKDGLRSILTLANQQLERLDEGISNKEDLIKILNALSTLLINSNEIIKDIGRKFSFYLQPFGCPFHEFLDLINNKLKVISLKIKEIKKTDLEHEISIILHEKEESISNDIWLRKFYEGMISEGVVKAIGGQINVHIDCNPIDKTKNECIYHLKSEQTIKI